MDIIDFIAWASQQVTAFDPAKMQCVHIHEPLPHIRPAQRKNIYTVTVTRIAKFNAVKFFENGKLIYKCEFHGIDYLTGAIRMP